MQHTTQQQGQSEHARGPQDAALTVIEYADFQCPYCARAHQVLSELDREFGGIRLVYRHLPLAELHPLAELAAEAAEAAGAQGRFWDMHDQLFERQRELTEEEDLATLADSLELDGAAFHDDLQSRRHRARVQHDSERARGDGAHRTPTFFINGAPYHGDSDFDSLEAAFRQALGQDGAR